MKHIHAEEIHAWADGKKIEKFLGCTPKGAPVWRDDENPSWDLDSEYRVKPEVVYGRQRVAKGELFYYIKGRGTISTSCDGYSYIADGLFAMGNYYHTVAEATKARDKQLAYMRIKDALAEHSGDWVADWSDTGQKKYCVMYNHGRGKFFADWFVQSQFNMGLWGTEEACQYVINNMEDELKLVWEVA